VQQLARDFLDKPYEVHVGSLELRANKSIKQVVEVVGDYDKYPRLLEHMKAFDRNIRALLFVETKKGADQLTNSLRREGYDVVAIHGDKSQQDRDRALRDFRNGRCKLLCATDVASRGLDIKGVEMVVNFDMPQGIEDYIHRIGRTGRAGATGVAVSFMTEKHSRLARELTTILKEANQDVPPGLEGMIRRGGGGGGHRGGGRYRRY